MKMQNGLTFLVLAYPGWPGKEAVKWVSVCPSLVARKLQALHVMTIAYHLLSPVDGYMHMHAH